MKPEIKTIPNKVMGTTFGYRYSIKGSQVLCEFWNVEGQAITGFLTDIRHYPSLNVDESMIPAKDLYVCHSDDHGYLYCRVFPNHWISNANGVLLLPEGLDIEAKFSNGIFNSGYTLNNNEWAFKGRITPKKRNDTIEHVKVTRTSYGWEW